MSFSNRSNHVMTASNHGKKMNGIDNPSMEAAEMDSEDRSRSRGAYSENSQPGPTSKFSYTCRI